MRPYTPLSVAPRELTFVSFNKRFAPRLLSLGTALIVLSCGGGGGDKTPTSPPPPVMVLTTVTVSLSAATIQVGQAATASATGADQNGGAIGTGTIAWSSSSSAVASISAGGAITAVAVGQTTITATAGGRSGQATLTVIPVPVASVVISPTVPALMFVGGTQQLTAATLDANNATLSGRTVTWSSSDTTKARVSNTGLVTAVAVGAASIVAASEGKSANASITVLPVPVAAVTVSPSAASLGVGASQQLAATTVDAGGATLTGRVVVWSTSDATKATVTASGLVTAVAVGTVTITATSETKVGNSVITVTAPAPVATVTVAPLTASVLVGGTVVLTATARDANGNILSGRSWSWTANLSVATGTYQGNVLTATGVSPGITAVTATSEGKSGSATITVTSSAQLCSSTTALQLSVGQVVALTAAQKASLCLGSSTSTEFVLIPFNNSTVAASVTSITLTGTNTTASVNPPAGSLRATRERAQLFQPANPTSASWEWNFRRGELRDLASASARVRSVRGLTGVPANPAVGSVVQLNANSTGNLCTSPKQLHPAKVVAVLPHTIVLVDTLAPAGGYSSAELIAFGTSFDTLGYGIDTLNFGAPTDIDNNGKVAIFFTQGVNQVSQPAGGYVGGYFSGRDLYAATSSGCIASNEGEIFYLPVPDPNSTINANYGSKTSLAAGVLPTLVHEFQHLINSGRRLYVNNASVSSEEVWLNEGLSHIAEELLYYRVSGNGPQSNIDLSVLRSTQAQLDAVNGYQIQNLSRLKTFLQSPESISPYAQNDDLGTRGAIWQFLRYSSDRRGGLERNTWYALVNSTTSGQTNFNSVFGSITTLTRDWVVAQFLDDTGLGAAAVYTNPSWNYRSILPAINSSVWPLLTRSLLATPVSISLNGGSAAYFRFGVAGSVYATIAAASSGLPVPSSVDFILVRTK